MCKYEKKNAKAHHQKRKKLKKKRKKILDVMCE